MRSYNRRKNIRIQITLIFMLLFSSLIIGTTIARYQSTLCNQSTANAARWVFKLSYKDNVITTSNYSVNLEDTITSHSINVEENYIAPGTEGKIPLSIDCRDCEVGVKYTMNLTDINSSIPNQLKFYTTFTYDEDSQIILNKDYTGYFNLSDIENVQDKTIYWKWFPIDDTETNADDMEKSGKEMNINISIEGEQQIQ